MRLSFRARSIAAIALTLVPLAATQLEASTPAAPKILILNSYDQDTPPHAAVRDIFMQVLEEKYEQPLRFEQFNLQQRGRSGTESHALQAQLLRNLHGDAQPDLVAAFGPPAAEFWLRYRGRVFPDVPMVATGSELRLKQMKPRPGDVMVADRWTYREVVENILQLRPATRNVLVVFGASQHERRLAALASEDLRVFEDRVLFRYTNDLSLTALQAQLARLDPDAAVLFGIFDSDVNGLVLGDRSGLALVRAASPVPVFGFFDNQLGLGIVGGPLIQLRLAGMEAANSAVEVLRGLPPGEAFKILPIGIPTYDWRELRKWGIETAALPSGSIVEFQPVAPWKAYGRWIALAALLLLAQTALIAALLIQRRRRQKAEQVSSTLSSRLITAQEDEYRRLARELHDNLSQRLARLSIDAGYLAANPGTAAAGEAARNMQPELSRLGKDLHDMSYRLHPSLVDDLGLAVALRNEVDRYRPSSGIEITARIGAVPHGLPRETALGLYRVAQEALRNAVRHGSPRNIELSIDCGAGILTLTVRDDGCGFDTSASPARSSLGLHSMRERVRNMNGSLSIHSRPGSGTRVIAAIPLAEHCP